MERAPDDSIACKLPMAVTAPPPRPHMMPAQDIAIWTPRRAIVSLFGAVAALISPVRGARIPRRT